MKSRMLLGMAALTLALAGPLSAQTGGSTGGTGSDASGTTDPNEGSPGGAPGTEGTGGTETGGTGTPGAGSDAQQGTGSRDAVMEGSGTDAGASAEERRRLKKKNKKADSVNPGVEDKDTTPATPDSSGSGTQPR